MKLAILFLLGFCAIAAQASYEVPEYDWEPQATDTIRSKLEEFLKVVTNKFNAVAAKVKEIVADVNNKAGDLVLKAKGKANQVKGEIQGKINEMKQKGGEIAECAKKLEPDYWQVEKDLMTDVKKCAGDVYVASEEMREDVSRGMSGIANRIRDFNDLVGDCLGWNPINTVKCVTEKMTALKQAFGEILSACGAALKAAEGKSVEIMKAAHACNSNALSRASERVKELNQRLSKCYSFYDEIVYY